MVAKRSNSATQKVHRLAFRHWKGRVEQGRNGDIKGSGGLQAYEVGKHENRAFDRSTYPC